MLPGQILAHRGLWASPGEKNSFSALTGALQLGFGLETDVRDRCGELVISHDPPLEDATPLASLLEEYRRLGASGTLALNIKSDGLTKPLVQLLRAYAIERYFVFDMSVPDMLHYGRAEAPYFSRRSDLETEIVGFDRCHGVWLDAFESDWYKPATIEGLLGAGKHVAVVSPELHGRDRTPVWTLLRRVAGEGGQLLCCTDHPVDFQKWMS